MTDRQILWRDLVLGAGSGYGLTQIEGWRGLPDMRVSNSDRPGRHGQYPGTMFASSRVVTVSYRVSVGSRLGAVLDALEAGLAPDENPTEEQLTVTWDGATRMVLARCDGHQLTMEPRWSVGYAEGVMRWTATDPRKYGTALRIASTGLPAPAETGVAFPLAFPLDFGPADGVGGDMTVLNSGGAYTWPVFVIDGPVTGPVITCLDDGKQLAFDQDFTVLSGQQLVIDTDSRSVLLNATTSRRDQMVTAEWFALPPMKRVRIGFSAADYSADARLTVQWRDAWL